MKQDTALLKAYCRWNSEQRPVCFRIQLCRDNSQIVLGLPSALVWSLLCGQGDGLYLMGHSKRDNLSIRSVHHQFWFRSYRMSVR